jgi:hypothetical protein
LVARALRKTVGPGNIKVTTALLKFCREHDCPPFYVERLSECLVAMNEKNISRIEELARVLGHAGMGSFLDWVPTAKFENEDPEYVDAIWNALVGHWLETMRPFRNQDA